MLKYNGDPCKEHGRSKIQTYFQSFYILCCECSKLCADCRANEHHSCCNQLDPSLHRITEGAIGPGDNDLKKVRADRHPCRAADDVHKGRHPYKTAADPQEACEQACEGRDYENDPHGNMKP